MKDEDILSDYTIKDDDIDAKPGVYNWRKRLNEKRAKLAKNKYLKKIPQQDAELSKFGNLVIGEGLTQEP